MPAVAVTGPRQSGKTTLCRATFPELAYVSLEPLDTREFAAQDPRGFLRTYGNGAIIDEVQRVPALFSYLQEEIDRDGSPGRFVLTGSQQFGLSAGISQSLAGRIALLQLLPLGLEELRRFPKPPTDLWSTVWAGGYPRIHDRGLDAGEWLSDYASTYVQRDVRQVLRVTDLDAFARFLRLAAGRTAQEERLSALGADTGVSHQTIKAWFSVLDASFVTFRLPSWRRNFRKRIVKAAKLHFVDSGLACHLLGIRQPDQLRTHPLRGALFETWVAAEILKARVHAGRVPDLFHLREERGYEIDLVAEAGRQVIAVEAKSAGTVASEFVEHLQALGPRLEASGAMQEVFLRLVYGGDRRETRNGVEVIPWSAIQDAEW
jgi:hypothetical protein